VIPPRASCIPSRSSSPRHGRNRRREPTATALYPIAQHHLEDFLSVAADADFADFRDQCVPAWAEDDFRAYLRCGILAHGFARARCGDGAAVNYRARR
jgi:hypothetical protein